MDHPIEVASSTTKAIVSKSELSKGEKFLRLSSVRDRIPYSRATIYRIMADGKFPRPIALGPGAVAWRESEIDAWIQARILGAPVVEVR